MKIKATIKIEYEELSTDCEDTAMHVVLPAFVTGGRDSLDRRRKAKIVVTGGEITMTKEIKPKAWQPLPAQPKTERTEG